MNARTHSQITNLWDGWHVFDDLLFDDAGNFYRVWEIRAMPYVMGLNRELNRLIDQIRPPLIHEPVQLELPFPRMWNHQYEWLRRRGDRH